MRSASLFIHWIQISDADASRLEWQLLPTVLLMALHRFLSTLTPAVVQIWTQRYVQTFIIQIYTTVLYHTRYLWAFQLFGPLIPSIYVDVESVISPGPYWPCRTNLEHDTPRRNWSAEHSLFRLILRAFQVDIFYFIFVIFYWFAILRLIVSESPLALLAFSSLFTKVFFFNGLKRRRAICRIFFVSKNWTRSCL